MPRKPVFDSTESVIGVLWNFAFTFFAVRLAFFYAALAVGATAVLAWVGHAVLPFWSVFSLFGIRHVSVPRTLLHEIRGHGAGSGLQFAKEGTAVTASSILGSVTFAIVVVGLCSRFIMGYARVPRLHVLRLLIGALAAVYVGIAWQIVAALADRHCCNTNITRSSANEPLLCKAASLCNTRIGVTSHTTISSCAAIGTVFIATMALMPWVSMVMPERSDRRYRYRNPSRHRRGADSIDRLTSTSVSSSENEHDEMPKKRGKSALPSSERDTLSGRKLRTKTTKKRYDLRRNPKKTEKLESLITA